MKLAWRFGVALTLFAATLLTLPGEAAPMKVLVPAYFYPVPGGEWEDLTAAAAQFPITAILNPNSGPGASIDPNYVAAVTSLRGAGGQVIGYVHTSYATRSITLVQAEIDSYLAWYPLDGIFIDEMTNDASAAHLDYYEAVYDFIKSRNGILQVVANPGTNTEEAYLTRPAADVLVIFENDTGYPTFVPSAWTAGVCADRLAHLCYDISSAAVMQQYVDLAVARNAGWIYVTNDRGANPWDTLPAYWSQEVTKVSATQMNSCTSAVPEGLPAIEIGASQNPFVDRTHIYWSVNAVPAGPYDESVVVEILDAAGRRVRRWTASGSLGVVIWDGLDDSGARAPAGVYFVRLRSAGVTGSVRVVRLGG